MVEKTSKGAQVGTVSKSRESDMARLPDPIDLQAQVKRLSSEVAEYRHAYETTARDRDRLLLELDQLREFAADNETVNAGALAPRAVEGRLKLRSMFFVTMPKSGTLYLMKLFTLGLGLRYMHISLNGFPSDSLDLSKAKAACSGNCFSMAHLDSSATNLQMLDHFFGRFVVHLRDPRQALWSWFHHVEKLFEQGRYEDLLRVAPMIPCGYLEWPFVRKFEWQIANHLPSLVQWTKDWLRIHEGQNHKILLCDYEALASDIPSYVDRVLDHFSVPHSEFAQPSIEKSEEVHFRSGDPNEWRENLSQPLVDCANAAVPNCLLEYMNWRR